MNDIDRLVAGIAPDPGPGMTPGARELFDEITTAPVLAPARRPWRFSVPIVAGLVAATMVLSWVLPTGFGATPASAALDIKPEGGYYVITVKDLYASPKMYESELRARGLKITLNVASAPPSLDGRIMVMDWQADGLSDAERKSRKDLISTIDRPGACRFEAGCPIGLKVPITFTGRAFVSLARKGRPGEKYNWRISLAAPGEPLHCVDFVNKTLDEVRPMLEGRGITLKLASYDREGTRDSAPGSWYVHDAVLESSTSAIVLVSPTKKRLTSPESAPFAPENRCAKPGLTSDTAAENVPEEAGDIPGGVMVSD
ncbi:hypothetical protein [Streptosporangium lutulentum]|uniref:PASTA domain-containing protein n=1 Tax=Streptosporangium lutulentum TaxID=1461250 RepID=A0ABT9QRC8_9ACTN|nr:hypothetical protein [Streptosporangium lutulentum]MDP9848584.1 hypothetical protein [Streptosporangium lutulentum]